MSVRELVSQNASLVVTVLAVLLTVLLLASRWWNGSKTTKTPALLLVGPSGAGKTSLYYRWIGHKPTTTVTSIAPNETVLKEFPAGNDACALKLRVVDLPGHPKLDQFVIDELQNKDANIFAVVFVLDASSGDSAIAEAAARLYKILELTEPKGIRVLIAANKIDLFSALSASRISQLLEKQITELRQTQAKSIGGAGDDDFEAPVWLGADTPEFHFKDLDSEVEVIEGSVKQGRTEKWQEWISFN